LPGVRPDRRVRIGPSAGTVTIALVAIAFLAGGCGGDDEGGRTAGSTTGAAAGSGGATAAQGEKGQQRAGGERSGGAQSGGSGDGSGDGPHTPGGGSEQRAAGTDGGAESDGSDHGAAGTDGGADSDGADHGAAGVDEGAPTVEAAITAVLTGAGSPEQACGAYVTERFLRRAYGGRANCLAARRPNALAHTVEITRSGVDEEGAHAVAVPSGGPYDGAKVEIGVVPASDAGGAPFKVDSLKAHVPAGP
jgi:hypothetical protein